MTTAVVVQHPPLTARLNNGALTLFFASGDRTYTDQHVFSFDIQDGQLKISVTPIAPPAPPPPPPPGDYIEVGIAFSANKQPISNFPASKTLALRLTVPADTPPGSQGSIMISEHGTGPMKRAGYLNQIAGQMSGYLQQGTTLEFRYIVGKPALQYQTRLEPGQTYYVNVQTTKPTEPNCPVVVQALPPK